jgi:tripartite-type tricarboxylate transporter receptor subunit TctC
MTKELPAFFLAAMFIVAATTAFGAKRYPSKPVRLIVPFAPGGNVDIVTKEISAPEQRGREGSARAG